MLQSNSAVNKQGLGLLMVMQVVGWLEVQLTLKHRVAWLGMRVG
jgi:hypothetical protein